MSHRLRAAARMAAGAVAGLAVLAAPVVVPQLGAALQGRGLPLPAVAFAMPHLATSTAAATATVTRTPQATPGAGAGNLGSLAFVGPVRVLDTRTGVGYAVGAGGQLGTPATIAPNGVARYQIAGRTFGGVTVPGNATGVLVNVTIVQGSASGGFLTVYPGDAATPPNASTVYPATAIASNFWSVGLPTSGANMGQIAVNSIGDQPRDVILDLVGFYSPSNPAVDNLVFVSPARVLDTRAGTTVGFRQDGQPVAPSPLPAGQVARFALGGKSFGGTAFPADVSGILAHVTIVQGAPSGGFTTLLPGDFAGAPTTSTVNPSTAIAANAWAVGLPASGAARGSFGLYTTNADQDVIVDVVGYFSPTAPNTVGQLSFVTPQRVVDTRSPAIGFNELGQPIQPGRLTDGTTRRFKLSGQTFGALTLPSDLMGGLVNTTIVQPAASGGFVTIFPGDGARPAASTVNPTTAVAASFWYSGVPTGASYPGTLAAYSAGDSRDLILDLVGYYR